RDGYEILYKVYDRLRQPDSANLYFRRYATLKESVISAQTKGRLAAYKYEQRLVWLNNEKAMQQAKIDQETFIKNILAAGFLLVIFLGGLLLRNSRLRRWQEKQRLEHQLEVQQLESEKVKAGLRQQAAELEMQALRAQMNPHFIFNSLNAINHFILQNDKQQATYYLTRFSRLVRLILQNSQAEFISLEKELEALQHYLELEALRFNHQFDFRTQIQNDIAISSIKVPPLIIQPFVENAIWHGLLQKTEKGFLQVTISQHEDWLIITITDNGIGRKKATALKNRSAIEHNSMGMEITTKRIAKLQTTHATAPPVHINDLVEPDGTPAGTEVTIKMPVMYDQINFDR
ncbi:MAG TPA: histidine kinase, partial [Flavisolibacter sp.]